MKVCSLYGAGYYYMPGTDICLKLGGYVRWQYSVNPGTSISAGPLSGQGGRNTRADEIETAMRTRAVATVDTRQQTAYGTLRTYILLGFQQDSTSAETTAPSVYMTRGFLQIAGFTFGKATSYFDIVPGASFSYNAGFLHHPDTGDAGKMLAAYTAQFGNGLSATISLEQARDRGIVRSNRAGAGGVSPGGTAVPGDNPYSLRTTDNPISSTEGGIVKGVNSLPDLVANIRVDQAWGSVLIGGALHNASGQYYGSGEDAGHPPDKLGWAITGGFVFNLPMIAAGDRLAAGVVYANGATGYASVTPSGAFLNQFRGMDVGFGFWEDGIYGPTVGGGVELTTAWSFSAAFEHFWTPALRTSLYGSYVNISHNTNARSLICNSGGTGTSAAASGSVFTPGNPAVTGCDPDWSSWNIGTRTQWEPIRGLIMGVDVIYSHLNTARSNSANLVTLTSTGNPTYAGAKPNGVYTVSDQSAWTGTFRIQRDFLP